jgi:hypothetical protein
MTMSSLERSLAMWLEEVEPREAPAYLLTQTFAATRVTRQRQPILARVGVALADARFFPRLELSPLVAIALIALLALLLLGAVIVGGRLLVQHTGWRVLDRVPVDGAYTWVSDVSAGGAGLVAVGNGAVPAASACGRELDGRVWTSANGADWAEQAFAGLADARLEKVVQAGGKVYALGTTGAACDSDGLPTYATWTSADASAWTRLADSSALDGSFVTSVIDAGGVPLAFGMYQQADPPDGSGAFETRIWRATENGWSQLASFDQAAAGRAVASGHIVLATTFDREGKSRLLRSEDGGQTWSETAVDVDAVGALAAVEGRFVLAGYRVENDVDAVSVTLVSEDGRSWSSGGSPPFQVVELWAVGNHFLAGGMDFAGEQGCAERTSAPIPTPYLSLDPGETSPVVPTEPTPSGSFCLRLREPGFVTSVSEDGITWRESARLPDRGNDPPAITVPIPAASYSLAGTRNALVVVNPTFGGTLWVAPFDEFVQSGPSPAP